MGTVATRGERARKETSKTKTLAAPTPALSEEDIRLLAYRLYERRCESGSAGDAAGDWFQAEHLLSKSTPAASTKGN